ncbi:protein-(glutamine-N5) methyltransferase, release factor-specific [Salipaludibacillus keqinensis]|uniref:Release factor glutamine methyltransferase n=1 Tax=Salipaludibacillus keqinensis TaxID=2045207 RepID=A0A323TA86_9BACI|nr:peptide chain release factor N(5)-glutamine methyltransferase [Salipaludibacillus keqinensis]PYZ92482.1 protein-(glutamine-N5) methyltransferase, release factor-specific [Salipaludibacillus keqinensis]
MKKTFKVYEALKWASSFLEEHHYEKEIGHRLLQHHTGWSRARMLAEMHTPLNEAVSEFFIEDVRRAASGIPVQHITGEETFYGRAFTVNEHVLIPRPETEELIEAVVESVNDIFSGKLETAPLNIIDVGTGSGIIAITLSLELSQSRVLASDISSEGLAVAKQNGINLGAEVAFSEGDLLDPFITAGEKASVIVSNPPYIPEGDRAMMKENVKDHEPEMALFAGVDGLDIYRRLVKQIPYVLNLPGVVAFEIGHDQGEAVRELLLKELPPTSNVRVLNDMNGNQRIVLAKVW